MADSWRQDFARQQRECERSLRQVYSEYGGMPDRLRRAMAHSLFGGGKRLRPVLLAWTHDALATSRRGRKVALRAGAALEMIHTYSLIHDDLPAMDDDVLRRGLPTCHVAYDEATAILAGDGLLTLAFEVLASCAPAAADLVALIAAAAGPAGMVGGQQEDLLAEGAPVTAARVRRIHARKTAALIAASLGAGAVTAGAGPRAVEKLLEAGRWLGLAFQGADDLLDVTASSGQLGKSAGKDEATDKATWVRIEGVDAARRRMKRYGGRGQRLVEASLPTGPARDRLIDLAAYLWSRDR